MVVFNDLRIAEDYSSMLIDCAVDSAEEYENIYIKSIHLEYYKNSVTFGVPSSKAILLYNNSEDDTEVIRKRIRVPEVELYNSHIGVDRFGAGMFYIIVTCDGSLPASVSLSPCGSDSMVDVGIVIDWKMVYEKGMTFVNWMTANKINVCTDTSSFEDFVLLWHGLTAALASQDYRQVERLWDMFTRVNVLKAGTGTVSGCGCR